MTRGARTAAVVFLVAAALAAAWWLRPASGPRAADGAALAPTEAPPAPVAAADGGSPVARGSSPPRIPSGSAEAAPASAGGAASLAASDATSALAARWGEYARAKTAAKKAHKSPRAEREGAESAEEAAKAALVAARSALIEALRREPAGWRTVLAAIDASSDEAAVALARALRYADAPGLEAALAERARAAPSPIHRLAAIVALEGREPEAWFVPVRDAFRADADARVRDEAGNVLARALADRGQSSHQAAVRDVLLADLSSSDPRQRSRAVLGFLADREAPEDVRRRLSALSADPDPTVRADVASVLRVLSR